MIWVNAKRELMIIPDLVQSPILGLNQFLEVVDLLLYALVNADMVRNTLNPLVFGVIFRFDLGFFRNELDDFKLFNFLLIIWEDELDVVSRVNEEILLYTLHLAVDITFLHVYFRNSQAVVVPDFLEDLIVKPLENFAYGFARTHIKLYLNHNS